MRNKVKWIIAGTLALIVIVLGCLYCIPKTTPFDITLDAVKLDGSDDTNLGTVQIRIHGNLYEYLLRSDELELHIDDFDHLYDIHPWQTPNADGTYDHFGIDLDAEDVQLGIVFQASSTVTGEGSATINVLYFGDMKKMDLFISPSIYATNSAKDDPSLNLVYQATLE